MSFLRKLLGLPYPHSIRVDEADGFYLVGVSCTGADKELERLGRENDELRTALKNLTGEIDESAQRAHGLAPDDGLRQPGDAFGGGGQVM